MARTLNYGIATKERPKQISNGDDCKCSSSDNKLRCVNPLKLDHRKVEERNRLRHGCVGLERIDVSDITTIGLSVFALHD